MINCRCETVPAECPPPNRGSGRTTWLVDQVCNAVAAGQPKCYVQGHTLEFSLRHLWPMVIRGLEARGIQIERIQRVRIDAEGSIILFGSTATVDRDLRGRHGFGVFVDHFAAGEH